VKNCYCIVRHNIELINRYTHYTIQKKTNIILIYYQTCICGIAVIPANTPKPTIKQTKANTSSISPPCKHLPRISKKVTYKNVPVDRAVNKDIVSSLNDVDLELNMITPMTTPIGLEIANSA